MQFIALDLEWNNVYGKKIKGFFNEIIEFGAVKIDSEGNVFDEFTCLINTQVGKKLRANTKELTHITNDEIKTGILFTKAVSEFKKWIGKEKTTLKFITNWGKNINYFIFIIRVYFFYFSNNWNICVHL